MITHIIAHFALEFSGFLLVKDSHLLLLLIELTVVNFVVLYLRDVKDRGQMSYSLHSNIYQIL